MKSLREWARSSYQSQSSKKRPGVLSACLEIATIPEIPKDVIGHDAQEGDSEEIDEDLDLAADDGQDTGQPVTVVDLGEKRRGSKLFNKSDIPNLTIIGVYIDLR